MAAIMAGSIALLLLALTAVFAEGCKGRCAELHREFRSMNCSDPALGPQKNAGCQEQLYHVCINHCTMTPPTDEACYRVSGYFVHAANCRAIHEKITKLKEESEAKSCLNHQEKLVDPVCARLDITTLDDAWRNTSNIVDRPFKCDKALTKGWYRMKLDGKTAQIPTSCVERKGACGTYVPIWLDLEGKSLPTPGNRLDVNGCGTYGDNCCYRSHIVTMINCGVFFAYLLDGTPDDTCNYGYCAEEA